MKANQKHCIKRFFLVKLTPKDLLVERSLIGDTPGFQPSGRCLAQVTSNELACLVTILD